MGYEDSSNLYAFAGGDPVNRRDPTGMHAPVTRVVGGIEFSLMAPSAEEVKAGGLGLTGSFKNPMTGKVQTFTWSQHEAEMFLLQARVMSALGESYFVDAFKAFYGVGADEVSLTTGRIWWNSLKEHKEDIVVSSILAFVPYVSQARVAVPVPRTPRINMLQPRGGTIRGVLGAPGQLSAVDEKAALPKSNKTVSTADDAKTISGWTNKPEGYTSVTPEEVLEHQKKIGHPTKRAGAMDQGKPGRYYASHAERQAALARQNAINVEVSSPMCSDCINYFQKQAMYVNRPIAVVDPKVTRVFYPDGEILVFPH
jgi:hypothetical protein